MRGPCRVSLILRPYQEQILTDLRAALRDHRSALVCAPPGAGKGSLIAYMVHSAVKKGKRITFCVRGLALVQDMSRRLTKLGVEHGVLMGGKKRERWHPVQVASVDTLFRMLHRPASDLVILDEARQFSNESGRKIVEAYPDAKIVGADGTPALINGSGLGVTCGGIFEAMVVGPDEQALIDMGFLVPSQVIGIPNPPDVSKVKKTGGDFNQKSLAEICDKVKLVGDIVEHWERHARGLKTVAFGVDQAHARHIVDCFRAAGHAFEYVDANTPNDEREAIYDRLDNGDLVGLGNVAIAGVGWDHPRVECIVAARPTASLPLWRQMIGRGSRTYPGKKRFVILDHANNSLRHWPHGYFETPPIWTLDGPVPHVKDGDKSRPVSMCKRPVPVPPDGVPSFFTGPLSKDGRYMLPSYHHFPTGPEICPYCGIPLRGPGREIEVEAGAMVDHAELREKAKAEQKAMAIEDWRNKLGDSDRRKKYMEFVQIAKDRGYKETWPSVKFKIIFGKWPEREWIKHKDDGFEDPAWDAGVHALTAAGRGESII